MADQFIYQMTDTWNNGATAFNGIKMDVTDSASLSTSRLIDLLIGGASKFAVQKDGSIFSTSSSAGTSGVIHTVYHNSASPAANDIPYKLLVQGEDSAGNTEDYAEIQVRIDDPTSTTEDASLLFRAVVAGTMTTLATMGGASFTLGTNVAIAFAGTGAATTRANLGVASAHRGYIFGLTLSNSAGDSVNDITAAAGSAAEEGTATPEVMTLLTALTKKLDAVWAVGDNQGMRASGAAIADTTYHIFEIRRPDTGVVDIAADTSPSGANIAANTDVAYTQKRRIGSIMREGGSIVAFNQFGDTFRRGPVPDHNSTAGFASALLTLSVPTGIVVQPILHLNLSVPAAAATTNSLGNAVAGAASTPVQTAGVAPAGGTAMNTFINGGFFTDTSARLYFSAVAAVGGITANVLNTIGWIDPRGRT